LTVAVRAKMKLDYPDKNGTPLRAHLISVWDQSGNMPEELDAIDIPDAAEYLWKWFWDLSAARGSNGFGSNPIGYETLQAWSIMTTNQPTPWEIEVLRRMDGEYMDIVAQKSREK
jgi:hypothetical protein